MCHEISRNFLSACVSLLLLFWLLRCFFLLFRFLGTCAGDCTTSPLRMLSKWPWISRCGDYWQQAELRTDGACRIMMMMMMSASDCLERLVSEMTLVMCQVWTETTHSESVSHSLIHWLTVVVSRRGRRPSWLCRMTGSFSTQLLPTFCTCTLSGSTRTTATTTRSLRRRPSDWKTSNASMRHRKNTANTFRSDY